MAKATRNVYLGGLDENLTESELRDDLCRFGPIDQVKIVRDKGIGFVHFLSISAAMKVVATLPTETEWEGKRVGYGKVSVALTVSVFSNPSIESIHLPIRTGVHMFLGLSKPQSKRLNNRLPRRSAIRSECPALLSRHSIPSPLPPCTAATSPPLRFDKPVSRTKILTTMPCRIDVSTLAVSPKMQRRLMYVMPFEVD